MWEWLNRPRSVKFWLLAAAAVVVVPFGWGQVVAAVDSWGAPPQCRYVLGCGRAASPAVDHLAVGVALFAVAAVLVWLAARAYPEDPRER